MNNSEKLGWESKAAHYSRFRILLDHVACEYRKILDVGCGLGDLYAFLMNEGIACSYSGVDLLPHMIHRAQGHFPGVDFRCIDVIEHPQLSGDGIDVVFTAGVFNLKSYSGIDFLEKAFDSFTRIARETIVISLLHADAPDKEPDTYCYFDPPEVKKVLARPDWELQIYDGYLANDFTLVARRKVV